MKTYHFLILIIVLTACQQASKTIKTAHNLNKIDLKYPDSKKDTSVYETYLNGQEKVANPYRWLEDDLSKETAAWVQEENQLTAHYLDQIPYRETIKKELTKIYNYEKMGQPIKAGDYFFIRRNNGLQNQSVTYYKKGRNGEEKVFLDPNKLSKNGTITSSLSSFSHDKSLVAIAINKAGSDWSSIKIKSIADNRYLEDEVDFVKFSGASWYKKGFFYSRFPEAEGSALSSKNQFHSIYYHRLGTKQKDDILIFKDTQPETFNNVTVSRDEQYIFMSSSQGTGGNTIRVAHLKDDLQNLKWQFMIADFEHNNRVVKVLQDDFYILTNKGAKNKKLVKVNAQALDAFQDIIPEAQSLLENVSISNGLIFATYLENASSKVYQMPLKNPKDRKTIQLPGIGRVSGFHREEGDPSLFYSFTSFTLPTTIFEYIPKTGESTLFFKPKTHFNPEAYETKQVWYTSKDGTRVPMFLTYKKGLKQDATHPTLLYGYGGFSINLKPAFVPSIIPLLNQGGIYAMANLRGGSEFGETWHKQGMLKNKQNVFDDFIAAAEYLIQEKYTQKQKLAIHGGSNGGLLVGACMTQRPDLFQVALPAVGVMDMLKFDQFTIGWGWVDEYGSPNDPAMFHYLKNYSPLHNIKKTSYPATLVFTSDHDDRVVPAHSFKFIATLQEKNQNDRPMLIRIETNAGHGAGKPTKKYIEEETDKLSFMFFNMGYKQLPVPMK